MALPMFDVTTDPGPSFTALLDAEGYAGMTAGDLPGTIPHATTVVALRYADGVADRNGRSRACDPLRNLGGR